MIVQEDVPYTKEEVKAMVKTIHNLREQLKQLGWHPASELPPINEDGRSDLMVVIRDNKYCTYYKEPISLISQFVNGRWIHEKVKWWCYPPKEE